MDTLRTDLLILKLCLISNYKSTYVNPAISRERMTLNSSANIVSVLKQKMLDNRSQVEKYKEEIGEKENYFQVCIQLVIPCLPPYQC